MSEPIILCDVAGPVATITINRPEKLNALDAATVRALHEALDRVAIDPGVRAVVVTGAGDKAFVAGADIAAMRGMTRAEAQAFAEAGQGCFGLVERMPKPTIAAVNGFALGGGCELALACDVVLAADNARFGQPEVNLGVLPGFGGTQRLERRVGWGKANELLFTGDAVKADEALRIGLCEAVLPLAEVRGAARAMAEKIASKGPLAIAAIKRVRRKGLAAEAEAFAACFDTADQREGMTAFLEKRAAKFEGR
jgi:enoyl-CoA hydratase